MNPNSTSAAPLSAPGSLRRAAAQAALPSVAGQLVMVLYQMADTFFVARTGNDAMVTAVGLCSPVFLLLSAIANLFGIGGAGAMARALGSRRSGRFRDAEALALWGCTAATMLYCLLVLILADPLLDLLGGWEPRVHALAREYLLTAVVLGGLSASLSGTLTHLLRARGRSLRASLGVSLGGVLNILLDPLLMFVLLPRGMETLGAAAATALSNLCSLLWLSAALLRERKTAPAETAPRLMPRRSLFSDALPAELFKTGLPAFLMTVLDNISCAAAGHLMGLEGLAHQAGISVAKKLNLLAHSIARGMAQGVLPLLAYHDAAEERGKVLAVLRFSMCVSVGLALLCTGIGLVFAEPLAGLFLEKSGASGAYAAHFLRIFALGAPWSAAAYACISLFQATGNSLLSLALACARKGALDIPLMLLLRIPLAADGIIWATPVADALCCLMAAAALRRFVRPAAQHQKSRQDGEAALSAGEL